MVNPGAGIGVMVAICLFVIGPASVILNIALDRYWIICLRLACVFSSVFFAAWLWLDVLDPTARTRMGNNWQFVVTSFFTSLVVALVFGAPFAFVRFLGRQFGPPRYAQSADDRTPHDKEAATFEGQDVVS